jgi:hypothetical protein
MVIGEGASAQWLWRYVSHGAARRLDMAKTEISNADLVWAFTEKLKSFRDGAPAISIAIVPDKGGWTAIASRNDRNTYPSCQAY